LNFSEKFLFYVLQSPITVFPPMTIIFMYRAENSELFENPTKISMAFKLH
jgi:hypothetical protein